LEDAAMPAVITKRRHQRQKQSAMKMAVREAVIEAMREQRPLLEKMIFEILDDMDLSAAITEAMQEPEVSYAEVKRALRRKS
jgi:hypothetical protein